MRCLVTGGAGFIGSHLSDALIEQGNEVCVIDDLSTGRIENLSGLLGNARFTFVKDTILSSDVMRSLISECDVVYHLAAAVGVGYIMRKRFKTFEANVRGTEVVLDVACDYNVKVIIASSSEVYGKSNDVPYKEDGDRVLGPTTCYRWIYSCTKAMDEFLALMYNQVMDLPIVIARLFNTIGPRQMGWYGMVVPRFIESAMSGASVTVYGDGEQTRCFTSVGDVVKAVILLAECPEAYGQVFNIGSTEEVSINTLAQKIIDLTGSDSCIEHVPYDEVYGEGFEDMSRRVPDVSKIEKFVGWKPGSSLDMILGEMIGLNDLLRE